VGRDGADAGQGAAGQCGQAAGLQELSSIHPLTLSAVDHSGKTLTAISVRPYAVTRMSGAGTTLTR
jgi:hypothetical protein